MKHIKRIILLSTIVSLLIYLIQYFFFFKFSTANLFFSASNLAATALYSISITTVCSLFFSKLNQKLNWKKQGMINIVLNIIGTVLVVIPTYFLCRMVHLVYISKKYSLNGFLENEGIEKYGFVLIFSIAISLFMLALGLLKNLQKNKLKEQKIIAGTATAKFDALKNQLDPHFLFNSLNVLTSLIDENTEAAQKFTTSLSKVYRYVLEQKNKDLVSVEEELNFAKVYISLLQMRFENSIEFEFPENISDPDAKIIPLSLQLLLENTVKHNVVMPEKPLKIKIYEENGFLVVENNSQPKAVLKSTSGVGLENITQRYALLTKRTFSVQQTKNNFIAKLPILTKKSALVL